MLLGSSFGGSGAVQQLQAESATAGQPVTIVMITHDRSLAADFATHLIEMDVTTEGNQRVGYIARTETIASS
jgi:ABC-type cobalamin/Fe3+-siderophores transport system ATPase subunit